MVHFVQNMYSTTMDVMCVNLLVVRVAGSIVIICAYRFVRMLAIKFVILFVRMLVCIVQANVLIHVITLQQRNSLYANMIFCNKDNRYVI